MSWNIFYPAYLYYRLTRKLIQQYRLAALFFLKIYVRLVRRIFYRYRQITSYLVAVRYRLVRRLRFRYLRLLIFFMWQLWLKEIRGMENIPRDEPAIIVSNHLSYFDFWILSALLRKQTVFIAVKNLDKRSVVGWTMKLNTIIYVDREKPGHIFFKKVMNQLLEQRRLVVVYPEGTRSRTGKMLTPKPGFVKLALKAGVPIIPVAMRGTYEILPPHKKIPKLKKCEVFVGKKIYISPQHPEFRDIFFLKTKKNKRYEELGDAELQEIAFRIMDKIRHSANEEWDESVVRTPNSPPHLGKASNIRSNQ